MDTLAKLERLRAAVLAERAAEPRGELAGYLEKVRRRPYTVTDEEVAALLAAGHSEDEIFERTIGAALGVAIERVEVGLRALDDEEKEASR